MAEPKALIKKYSDRRLYDSTARRYVNLDEIARMIRQGVDVEVVDARSGKDLTRVVLTQIIVEATRDGEAGLPLQLLRQLVVASDRMTPEFLSSYLESAFELFKKAEGAVRSRVSEAKSAVPNPVELVRHLLGGPAGSEERDAEIEELRRRVQELETRLAERPRRKSARKKSTGSHA